LFPLATHRPQPGKMFDHTANGIGLLLTICMSSGMLLNVEMCGRAIINRVAGWISAKGHSR
jgi:hypothetical protein